MTSFDSNHTTVYYMRNVDEKQQKYLNLDAMLGHLKPINDAVNHFVLDNLVRIQGFKVKVT